VIVVGVDSSSVDQDLYAIVVEAGVDEVNFGIPMPS